MTPTVSAIIPAYNRAAFLRRALDSVFAQTRPLDEVIVIDDGSTDNTPEVISSYGNSVRYLRQPNAGPGAARNQGLREARCDYVAFLDSDDVWVPEKNARQLVFLQENPALDFIFADMAIVTAEDDDNNEAEIKHPQVHQYFIQHATDLKALFECLLIENTIPTSSVLLRRRCLEHVGYMDEHLRIAEDLEYWLRIARACRCGFLNLVVEKRHRHAGNLINNWAECNQCHATVLTRTLESYPEIPPRTQQLIRRKLAGLYYELGSYHLKRMEFATGHDCLRRGGPRGLMDWKHFAKKSASAMLRHLC